MSAQVKNSGRINGPTTTAFREKIVRLSETLFPRWSQVGALTKKIAAMQSHRVQLLKSESPSGQPSNAMAEAMMKTSNLLDEVRNFRSQIHDRVQSLTSEAEESEITIKDMERTKVATKVIIVQQGGMLPPDDQYGSWEYDSDDDEGRDTSHIADLDAIIKAEKAKVSEIMDNINFEATIDKMLRMDMSEFAVEAKMTSVELSDWDCDSDEFLYTKLPMSQTYGKMLEWFVKKFWQAVKEEEEEERRVQKTIEEVEVKEVMALGTLILNKPFVPICFTCKQEGHVDRDCPKVDIVEESGLNDEGKYAYLASRGQGVDRGKSKFCTTCNKPGHVEEYCRWTHPEEEQEDSCSYCGRDGHMADACWKLHPELHRVYLQNRKPRVCQVCRKPDHLTKYCPDGKSYKYGLRPAP